MSEDRYAVHTSERDTGRRHEFAPVSKPSAKTTGWPTRLFRLNAYTDAGYLSVYAATSPEQIHDVIR